MPTRLLLALVLLVAVQLAAGCGGDRPAGGGTVGRADTAATDASSRKARAPRFARTPPGWRQFSPDRRSVSALSWDYRPNLRGWGRPEVFRGDRITVGAILLCPGVRTRPETRHLPAGRQAIPVVVEDPGSIGALEGVPGSIQHRFQPLLGGVRIDLRVSFARPPDVDALQAARSVIRGGLILPPTLRCP